MKATLTYYVLTVDGEEFEKHLHEDGSVGIRTKTKESP